MGFVQRAGLLQREVNIKLEYLHLDCFKHILNFYSQNSLVELLGLFKDCKSTEGRSDKLGGISSFGLYIIIIFVSNLDFTWRNIWIVIIYSQLLWSEWVFRWRTTEEGGWDKGVIALQLKQCMWEKKHPPKPQNTLLFMTLWGENSQTVEPILLQGVIWEITCIWTLYLNVQQIKERFINTVGVGSEKCVSRDIKTFLTPSKLFETFLIAPFFCSRNFLPAPPPLPPHILTE